MREGGLEKEPGKKIEQLKEEKKDSVLYTRHSKAGYETYTKIKASDDPQAPLDPQDQIYPDLPDSGVQLAREKAEELFAGLDATKDDLFFVSSNLSRALETASIYLDVAKQKGFTVLQPDHVKPDYLAGNYAEQIGGGEIRVLRNLSLGKTNTLSEDVFTPDKYATPINWSAVPTETKSKWEKARAIVNANDYGSWGANMFHHAAEVKKILPEIRTPEELYEKEFKNLVRLAKFGLNKAKEHPRNVKILAFGHENYIGHALQKYFQEHEINNCETIALAPAGEGELELERRGERSNMHL